MLSNRPIRVKFLFGLGLLLLLVTILSGSGLYATYAYRSFVKSLSWRAEELPLAADLNRQVADLRITIRELGWLQGHKFPGSDERMTLMRMQNVRDQFSAGLDKVGQTLAEYRRQLEHKGLAGSGIADTAREWETVHEIDASLMRVHGTIRDKDWVLGTVKVGQVSAELEDLQTLAAELPGHLHGKLRGFAHEVRAGYRTLIVGTWTASLLSGLIVFLLLKLVYRWIVRPLGVLIEGSRQVAAGRFSYRIHLDTHDEMAELAGAMNAMTQRFQTIRDDLDRQVQERTKQVVRSEQLASVGFLAAGVAHEINNPLASIAMSAESLEGRIDESLRADDDEHAVIRSYLRMIQSEAFRCKEITEKLLDFSRSGKGRRENTDLAELVQGVIDMVRHLGKYRRENIVFEPDRPIVASVNSQEIKQIVLNLLTNALESLDEGGTVRVELAERDGAAELSFADDGCGMEPDVLDRVFEPFFTRRHTGQGTGLGLSITHRIVSDHGGEIHAESEGPGRGSTFRVRLPLADRNKESENQYRKVPPPQAAVC